MSKKWFKRLKRWSEWRKICRKYDSKLTMLFDYVINSPGGKINEQSDQKKDAAE